MLDDYTFKDLMKQSTSEVDDFSKIYFGKDKKDREDREGKEEKLSSPIDELALIIDPNNESDQKELNMILIGFLQYPNDTLAQHHS